MTLVCGKCDQWFEQKDLRPDDAAAWDKAIEAAETFAVLKAQLDSEESE